MIGMALAIDHPERVDRLALLCTSAQLGPPSAWEERAAAVRAGGTSAIAETVVGRWLSAGLRGRPSRRVRRARGDGLVG